MKPNGSVPPSGNVFDVSFVNRLNSVNKEFGFVDTAERQPCKEYLLYNKLVRRGYKRKEIKNLFYLQLLELDNQ